jgi:hypothetical protein
MKGASGRRSLFSAVGGKQRRQKSSACALTRSASIVSNTADLSS